MATDGPESIDEYIAAFPPDVQAISTRSTDSLQLDRKNCEA